MDRSDPVPIKRRDIGFRDPHPDPQQAQSAQLALSNVDGVVSVALCASNSNTIHVEYNLNAICLRMIEELLSELGFHLDNSLSAKLKRALYYYIEQNEWENLSLLQDQEHNTRDIFIRSYRDKAHGCRDARSEHWRKYL